MISTGKIFNARQVIGYERQPDELQAHVDGGGDAGPVFTKAKLTTVIAFTAVKVCMQRIKVPALASFCLVASNVWLRANNNSI